MPKLNTSLAKKLRLGYASNIDDCVRAVSGFGSFAEMKDTLPTYYPKFYAAPADVFEARAQRRVVNAWNCWAHSHGRLACAFMQPGDWTAHFSRRPTPSIAS